MKALVILSAVLAGMWPFAPALSNPGDRDPSYRGCGLPQHGTFNGDLVTDALDRTYLMGRPSVRCLADGGADTTFVYASDLYLRRATMGVDGRLVGVVQSTLSLGVMRVNHDGSVDSTFGLEAGRSAQVPGGPFVDVHISAIAAQPDGKYVVIGYVAEPATPPTSTTRPWMARFDAYGDLDASFGESGFAQLPFTGTLEALAGDTSNWFVIGTETDPSTSTTAMRIAKVSPQGLLDTSFGDAGIARLDFWPFTRSTIGTSIVLPPDGRLVVGGGYVGKAEYATGSAVARLLPNGSIDPSFGYGGTNMMEGDGSGTTVHRAADGKLVVTNSRVVLRYNADGTLDRSFAQGGRKSFLFTPLSGLFGPERSVLLPNGKLLYAGTGYREQVGVLRLSMDGANPVTTVLRSSANPAVAGQSVTLNAQVVGGKTGGVVRFMQGENPIPGCEAGSIFSAVCTYTPDAAGQWTLRAEYYDTPSSTSPASASLDLVQVVSEMGTVAGVEFYHGAYGHYFVTSQTAEVRNLDEGVAPGWRRTGYVFPAWDMANTPDRRSVCRFWSGQAFGHKSSHFYTPYTQECADVKANPDWIYEGLVLAFSLPDANGECPAGTQALYRDYNNGQSGAPNHRYYLDSAMRSGMKSRGWIGEGSGPKTTFACVPAPATP